METGITLIKSERAPSCPSKSYLGGQEGCCFFHQFIADGHQDAYLPSGWMQDRSYANLTYSTVTFSSMPPRLLIRHPVASHHRHPPCAPCSPQPGCSHGNSKIRSGPVSAVSVSSVSLLGLFFFCSVRPSQRGFWLLPILALRSLFGFFFLLLVSFYIDVE